ncbi:MAG: hypothetical protein V3V41_03490, partial [Candidatus Heimdallarchaeota archaeon]
EEIEEEYEDLDDFESVSIEIEEFDDLAGLEELPDDEQAGLSESDVIITYGDKVEDEITILEKKYEETIERLQNEDTETALRTLSALLNESKIIDAHQVTSKISSYIGRLLSSQENHQEATEHYLLAVSEARKSEDKELHLKNLSRFGLNLLNFDPKDASVVFGQAVKLADELGDKEAYALNTLHFANCLSLEDSAQALKLYAEAKQYFDSVNNVEWIGIINYKIGKIHLDTQEYALANEFLNDSYVKLEPFPETAESLALFDTITTARELLLSGHSVKYRLKLPPIEIVDQTPNVRKVFQHLASTGSFDVLKGLKNMTYVQEPSVKVNFDILKGIFEDWNYLRLSDDDLQKEADLYEEIGDLYSKDNCKANGLYYLIAAQILFIAVGNNKRKDKLEKKIEKEILSFSGTEDTSLFNDLQLYLNYQIALGTYLKKPKDSTRFVNRGIEIARNRNNPLYEVLFKEILADIESGKDVEKAAVIYQVVIVTLEELEDQLDLLRVYEKYGNMMLPVHNDKGKELLSKALSIAQNLEKAEIITRLKENL